MSGIKRAYEIDGMASSCSICCESFTRSTRKKIACSFCDYEVCVTCQRTFLLSITEDPHCPNCRKGWDNDFLLESLPKTFINGALKKHRANVLYDRQVSMLPATQPEASRIRKIQQGKAEIDRLKELRREIDAQINTMRWNVQRLEMGHDVDLFENVRQEDPITTKTPEEQTHVRACPADSCKGFLLKKTWTCGLCDTAVCNKCLQIKPKGAETPHVCDLDDIESAKLIFKECKACPSCNAMTFKVDGCAQVWCVSCKTAFNWTTLKVETGRIHAPDYYRWMREHGSLQREPGDVPGGAVGANDREGGCMALPSLSQILRRNKDLPVKLCDTITHIHRGISHFTHIEIPYNRRNMPNYNDPTQFGRTLRVDFLLNRIDEAMFKRKIATLEKAANKAKRIDGVLLLLTQAGKDAFLKYMRTNKKTVDAANDLIKECELLRQYVNKQLFKIANQFSVKSMPYVAPEWYRMSFYPSTDPQAINAT